MLDQQKTITLDPEVAARCGVTCLSKVEIQEGLKALGYQLIEEDQLEEIEMGDAGTGLTARKFIPKGSVLPYCYSGEIKNAMAISVSENQSIQLGDKATAMTQDLQLFTIYVDENDSLTEEAFETIGSNLSEQTIGKNILLIHVNEARIDDKYTGYHGVVRYGQDANKVEIRSKINLEILYPTLLEKLKKGVRDTFELTSIARQDVSAFLPAIVPSEDEMGGKTQNVSFVVGSDSFFVIEGHARCNLQLCLVLLGNGLLFPVLEACEHIEPGELLGWSYGFGAYQENYLGEMIFWDKQGRELKNELLVYHDLLTYSEFVDFLKKPPLEIFNRRGECVFHLFSLSKKVLFQLEKSQIDFLYGLAEEIVKKSSNDLRISSSLKRGLFGLCERRIEEMHRRGYLPRMLTEEEIKRKINELLISKETAAHYLVYHCDEINAFLENKTVNRDKFFIPFSPSDDTVQVLNKEARAGFITMKDKAAEAYKANKLEDGVYFFQKALFYLRQHLIYSEKCHLVTPVETALYADKGLAQIYRNLGVLYSKLNLQSDALYCFTKCKVYLDHGFSHYFTEPDDVLKRYQAALESEISPCEENIRQQASLRRMRV